jgi:hypothetical protein
MLKGESAAASEAAAAYPRTLLKLAHLKQLSISLPLLAYNAHYFLPIVCEDLHVQFLIHNIYLCAFSTTSLQHLRLHMRLLTHGQTFASGSIYCGPYMCSHR